MTNYAYCTFILPVGLPFSSDSKQAKETTCTATSRRSPKSVYSFLYAHNAYSTALVDLFACNCFKFELSFYHKRTPNKFFAKQTVTSYYYICRINEQTILKSEPKSAISYYIRPSVCDSLQMCLCRFVLLRAFFLFAHTVWSAASWLFAFGFLHRRISMFMYTGMP